MIARSDYVGPITKSAEAMFDRAERRARRLSCAPRPKSGSPRAPSAIDEAADALGLTEATIRRWEDEGVVAFHRRNGRRVIDHQALTCLRIVADLRRAGLSLREIGWSSLTSPPTEADLRACQAKIAVGVEKAADRNAQRS